MFGKRKKLDDDFRLLFSDFSKSISLISDVVQLKKNFSAHICQVYSADDVLIYLLNPDLKRFVPVDPDKQKKSTNISFTPDDKLIFWLNVNKTWLHIEDNPEIISFLSPQERKKLDNLDAKLIFPFIIMNHVRGIGIICRKKSNKITDEQLRLLTIFFEQAGFAFENAMLYHTQKEKTKKLLRADRLATLGELAAGAAHEIRNPLTSIRSTIQYLQSKIEGELDKELAGDLIKEVDRINEIIQGMLSFSRVDSLKETKINLQWLIKEVLRLLRTNINKKGIELKLEYLTKEEGLVADEGQIKQVLLNIFLNAIQAVKSNTGKITITIDSPSTSNQQQNFNYLIEVKDNGTGIPDDKLEKIFDPFYTTKKDGTGLGLSISYGIISKHGGDISIESIIEKGTTIKIKLPNKRTTQLKI